jgi:hypothetical protein
MIERKRERGGVLSDKRKNAFQEMARSMALSIEKLSSHLLYINGRKGSNANIPSSNRL